MGIDRDLWLKAVADAGFRDAEDDQGAITIREFAAMIGLKRCAAKDRLDRMVATGAAVQTKKWGITSIGRRVHLTAYRLATPEPRKRGKP